MSRKMRKCALVRVARLMYLALLLILRIEKPWTRSCVARTGRTRIPLPLLTFLVLMPLVHFICTLPAVSLLLRAPLMLRRRPVVFGLSVLGAALLRGILEPCALGLIVRMLRHPLKKGKTYTLSRLFVSTHETRVFWRKLFIASCEAPFSFTPLCNLAWRWAGASVGRKGVVLSELHGAVDAPELIEIGSDSYLGAHVTLRPLKVEGSSVKAVGVSPSATAASSGPNTLLQPGSMIKGATGANSIVSSDEVVPDGRVAIGDAQKPCTLAWRPLRLDASTEWGWAVTSSLAMFATERLGHVVAVQAPRILLWVALGFVGRYPWSPPLHEVRVASLIHEAHTTPLLRVWLTLSTVASRNAALVLLLVACLVAADPFKPLTHILFKWLVVGKATETSKVPLRSGTAFTMGVRPKTSEMPGRRRGVAPRLRICVDVCFVCGIQARFKSAVLPLPFSPTGWRCGGRSGRNWRWYGDVGGDLRARLLHAAPGDEADVHRRRLRLGTLAPRPGPAREPVTGRDCDSSPGPRDAPRRALWGSAPGLGREPARALRSS